MKLEIEITEEELKSAVERKVRTAVADQTNQWGVDAYIKDQVKKHCTGKLECAEGNYGSNPVVTRTRKSHQRTEETRGRYPMCCLREAVLQDQLPTGVLHPDLPDQTQT